MGIGEPLEILERMWEGYDQRSVLIRPLWKKLGTRALPACMKLLGLVQEGWVSEELQFTLRMEPTRYLISLASGRSDGNPRQEASWKGMLGVYRGKRSSRVERHLDYKKLQRSRLLQGRLSHLCWMVQTTGKHWNASCHSPQRRPRMEFLASVFVLLFRGIGDTVVNKRKAMDLTWQTWEKSSGAYMADT